MSTLSAGVSWFWARLCDSEVKKSVRVSTDSDKQVVQLLPFVYIWLTDCTFSSDLSLEIMVVFLCYLRCSTSLDLIFTCIVFTAFSLDTCRIMIAMLDVSFLYQRGEVGQKKKQNTETRQCCSPVPTLSIQTRWTVCPLCAVQPWTSLTSCFLHYIHTLQSLSMWPSSC